MSEAPVIAACVKELDRRGAWHTNLHPDVGRVGLPDRIWIYRGHGGVVETKSQTGRLRPLQARELELVARAGGVAIVARHVDDLRQALDRIDSELDG